MAQPIGHVEKEFIFTNLREKLVPVELHIGTQRITTRLIESAAREVAFKPVEGDYHAPEERRAAVAYFRFRGRPMTFRSLVLEIEDGIIRLRQPTVLYRDLKRGFERIVNPEGISVSLIVQGTSLTLNYPASEMFDPIEEPQFDMGFDVTRISNLLTTFREKAEKIAAENRVVMFRERRPELLAERIVAHSGRILVLPPWTGDMQSLDISVRERLALRRHIEDVASDIDLSITEQYDQLLQQMQRKRIAGELYCPILYHQYVIGYLYLMRGGSGDQPFGAAELEFVRSFARVFSYSLQANGYFSGEKQEKPFEDAELIDISGSGLLCSHAVGTLDLGLYSEIGLRIHLGDTELPARGRIMRQYQDEQRVYHGVHFSNMALEHMETLFDRIYGEQYRGDIDSRGLADVEFDDNSAID